MKREKKEKDVVTRKSGEVWEGRFREVVNPLLIGNDRNSTYMQIAFGMLCVSHYCIGKIHCSS